MKRPAGSRMFTASESDPAAHGLLLFSGLRERIQDFPYPFTRGRHFSPYSRKAIKAADNQSKLLMITGSYPEGFYSRHCQPFRRSGRRPLRLPARSFSKAKPPDCAAFASASAGIAARCIGGFVRIVVRIDFGAGHSPNHDPPLSK